MSVLKRHSHLIIRCLQGTRRYNSEGRVYGGLLQAQYVCGMWLAEDIVSVLGLFDYLYAMYSLIRKRKCKKEMYFVMEIRKGRSELRVNKCSKSGRVGTPAAIITGGHHYNSFPRRNLSLPTKAPFCISPIASHQLCSPSDSATPHILPRQLPRQPHPHHGQIQPATPDPPYRASHIP